MKRLPLVLAALALVPSFLLAEPNPERWEKSIAAFEKKDQEKKPAPGGIVFTGSSSIALWKDIAEYFPGLNVLNRGFGGSSIPEVNAFVDRIVTPYQPKVVVLFCGGNDMAAHKRTPEQVLEDFRTFVQKVHAKVPEAKIVYISIHLPPARVNLRESTEKANRLIAQECAKKDRLAYVDIYREMQSSDGMPNLELYGDKLHPNARAYAIWAKKLRPALGESK